MNATKVSVIVLTYFHEEYIARALESVLNQKFNFSYEILVSDDNSQDDTMGIVKEYVKQYPNLLKVFSYEQNVGTCKNIFEAFLRAKGEYIVIMAGDDYLCDDKKLQKQADFLDLKKEYIAVSTSLRTEYKTGEVVSIYPSEVFRGTDFSREDFLQGNNYVEQGIMMRNIFDREDVKNHFSKIQEFSKCIEDLPICMFLFDYGKIFTLKDVTYSLTVRKPTDENQHNYNSIFSEIERIKDHLDLLNKLMDYYPNYNFDKRYQVLVDNYLTICVKNLNFNEFINIGKIPVKYIIHALLVDLPKRAKNKFVSEVR